MLPADDVSGVYPFSCVLVSQREVLNSEGHIQNLLGASDGSGNLQPTNLGSPVALIGPLRFRLSDLHSSLFLPGMSRCRGAPNRHLLALFRPNSPNAKLLFPPQGWHLQVFIGVGRFSALACGIAVDEGGSLTISIHIVAVFRSIVEV